MRMTAVERREQEGNAWAKRIIDEALRIRNDEETARRNKAKAEAAMAKQSRHNT